MTSGLWPSKVDKVEGGTNWARNGEGELHFSCFCRLLRFLKQNCPETDIEVWQIRKREQGAELAHALQNKINVLCSILMQQLFCRDYLLDLSMLARTFLLPRGCSSSSTLFNVFVCMKVGNENYASSNLRTWRFFVKSFCQINQTKNLHVQRLLVWRPACLTQRAGPQRQRVEWVDCVQHKIKFFYRSVLFFSNFHTNENVEQSRRAWASTWQQKRPC